MAEPFKNLFNPVMVDAMAGHLARAAPGFDAAAFAADAVEGFATLELKARAARIAAALEAHLPAGWEGVEAMLAALHPEEAAPISAAMDGAGVRGWAVMPMAEVVAARGLAEGRIDAALEALAAMTKRFSAEFAVRPLIAADPERAMAHVRRWAEDGNLHVRRLASEGTRPRLPWGMRLGVFVADPSPLLPVLGRLRDDPEEYVRRSVANSLNDIAKDHPDLVAGLAGEWLAGAPPERERLVRHGLRTLVKAGHRGALAALGLQPVAVAGRIVVATPVVRFGGALDFALELRAGAAAEVVLDYAVHHRKANGRLAPKVFKWRRLRLRAGEAVRLERRHAMRAITTRRYHDGPHRIEALVNGMVVAGADFVLEGAGQRVGTGVSPR
jgi:3-methyladenine DNA glycosylase AlkC